MFNIQYGLFVVTTNFEGRDNGCITNTTIQVTAEPNRISVAVNKANYTNELIHRSGVVTVSIISEKADFELFKHFGFQSGRDVDKFADFSDCRRLANGTLAVTCGTNAYITGHVRRLSTWALTRSLSSTSTRWKRSPTMLRLPITTIKRTSSRVRKPSRRPCGAALSVAMSTRAKLCPTTSFARGASIPLPTLSKSRHSVRFDAKQTLLRRFYELFSEIFRRITCLIAEKRLNLS